MGHTYIVGSAVAAVAATAAALGGHCAPEEKIGGTAATTATTATSYNV